MSTSTSTATTAADTIRLAMPSKGHLYEGIVDLLKTAGYKVQRASDRQYEATIAGQPRFHVVFMRPADIVTQVQEGRCHLGVTGMDVYAERGLPKRREPWWSPPTSATAAAAWWWPSPKAGSTSPTSSTWLT